MIAAAAGQVQTYGIKNKANVVAKGIELGSAGSRFIMAKEGTQLPILLQTPGMFSVYNALAAITVSFMLGVDMISIKQGIEAVSAVPGRFERLDTRGGDYSIILDYAHKPDSLESTLKTARGFSKGRLVCIFGCGGNRDAGKRPVSYTHLDVYKRQIQWRFPGVNFAIFRQLWLCKRLFGLSKKFFGSIMPISKNALMRN